MNKNTVCSKQRETFCFSCNNLWETTGGAPKLEINIQPNQIYSNISNFSLISVILVNSWLTCNKFIWFDWIKLNYLISTLFCLGTRLFVFWPRLSSQHSHFLHVLFCCNVADSVGPWSTFASFVHAMISSPVAEKANV